MIGMFDQCLHTLLIRCFLVTQKNLREKILSGSSWQYCMTAVGPQTKQTIRAQRTNLKPLYTKLYHYGDYRPPLFETTLYHEISLSSTIIHYHPLSSTVSSFYHPLYHQSIIHYICIYIYIYRLYIYIYTHDVWYDGMPSGSLHNTLRTGNWHWEVIGLNHVRNMSHRRPE